MVSPVRQFNAVADEERVLEVVRELVAELGHKSTLRSANPASHLDRDLGLGSLERVELLLRLEKSFGTRLDEEGLAGAETVQDLIAALGAANARPSDTSAIGCTSRSRATGHRGRQRDIHRVIERLMLIRGAQTPWRGGRELCKLCRRWRDEFPG